LAEADRIESIWSTADVVSAQSAPALASQRNPPPAEELENIDYMLDASPLIVRKLRHHAFHITNLRPYDYRMKGDARPQYFKERLGLRRQVMPVRNVRKIGKRDMVHNDALPNVDVDPETYLLDPKRGVELWNRVMEAGKRYNIAPTGPSDIRRIEAGILNYGIDMTLDNSPYELGLERLVNLDKPADFVGREALRRISREGPKKKLVGVEISGTKMDLNFTRYPIRGGGFITSCVHSPRLKKNIGYAMLPAERTAEKRLEVDAPDGVRSAVIVPMPFIDPKKEIAKS